MKVERQEVAKTVLSLHNDQGDSMGTILHHHESNRLRHDPPHWYLITKDDARQLAAILLHFAETGELKGGGDG